MVLIIKFGKNFALFTFIAFVFAFCFSGKISDVPSVSAKSAVLLCDGEVLYCKDAHKTMPMASTTKLMTAIITIENSDPDELVEILPEYCAVEGSSMYLKPGTKRTVGELLKGLLLVSGNDAALALADHVAGSEDAFTVLMNRKAADLGLENTHFVNPHGLNHEKHYSTAYDLARLMEYCMQNALFARISAMKSFETEGAQLLNHNKLLFVCDGCTGGKTGFTKAAGRCLVTSCEREGAQLICVTLSAPNDWEDHMKLYDWCYSNYSLRSVTNGISFQIPYVSENNSSIMLVPEKEKSVFVNDRATVYLKAEIPWFIFSPVDEKGAYGEVTIFVDGKSTGEYYLIYSDIKNHP